MKHIFFLAASGPGAGLTSVSLGVVRALDRMGVRVGFCKPITQNKLSNSEIDPTAAFIYSTSGKMPSPSIRIHEADAYVREDHVDDLMDRVTEKVSEAAENADVVVVEGLLPSEGRAFNNRLNRMMVSSLNAEVILVAAIGDETAEQFQLRLETVAALYGGIDHPQVIGCIINKIGKTRSAAKSGVVPIVDSSSDDPHELAISAEETQATLERLEKACRIFQDGNFEILGGIPANQHLRSYRTIDVARHLKAEVMVEGDIATRRVRSIALCARTVSHIYHVFTPGALLIMPADREDVIMGAALAALNGVNLAGIVLTSANCELDPDLVEICKKAFDTGLPVIKVSTGSYQTALDLAGMGTDVPLDDTERLNHVMDYIARNIFVKKLEARCKVEMAVRMSPAAFRHKLSSWAREVNKRIVLPEGDEPRTIQAAVACIQRKIARCVLLGKPEEIRRVANMNGILLPDELEIVDVEEVRGRYVAPLVEMRRSKNLSENDALEALEDNVYLGTMMLALGEVDGLVSGAVHSSANTIRPALQLIKTHQNARVVSSIFFMCLPEQVLVYGDCAVNPNPDSETLADIAVQSADSAARFGIPPSVALISYSTGESGSGVDVDKVRRATELAKAMRPDLPIDGPLQYDAAAIEAVALTKAPNSPVAGKATVFIFPDLNTGNTTYKAVQRSANLISIGPMLQGLKKPVNDLSRGALVDDIIYTIAVTAIQAAKGNDAN